jgi:hypothetical protein
MRENIPLVSHILVKVISGIIYQTSNSLKSEQGYILIGR